jgi:membrane protein YqaA with SNARE-associated domain
MSRLVAWVRSVALTLGAPGLFLVAFLDSSFLPLPGITDFLLIVLVTRHPETMPFAVAMGVLGSVAGCLVMHFIGTQGEKVLERFETAKAERAMAALRRHGLMAVLIPSLLPPPAPFKIFVILAGVVGIRRLPFAGAIAIGRTARYLTLGILAVKYGSRAQTVMRESGGMISLVVAGVLLAGFLVYLQWNKAQRRKSR